MKSNFQFTNLFGTAYKKGDLVFLNNGSSLLSPVGNQVTLFDLKKDEARTLAVNSVYNVVHSAVSPTAPVLLVVNEQGEAYLMSLFTGAVICTQNFRAPVSAVAFSPDGRMFAVAKGSIVMVFLAPGPDRQFNQFVLHRVFYGASDDIRCLDWTTDSRAFLAGSADTSTRVYAAQRSSNLVVYSLGGHSDEVVGAFFLRDSLDLFSVGVVGEVCHWVCDTPLAGLLSWQQEEGEDGDGQQDAEVEAADKQRRSDQAKAEQSVESSGKKILYRRERRFHYESRAGERVKFRVTSVQLHKTTNLLVTGLESGVFMLHMMPDFTIVEELNFSTCPITSVSVNRAGDWVALGGADQGQLAVWEWRSRSYRLRAQSHYNGINCLAYSPDGVLLATGGLDAKVKLWQVSSGRAFFTFSEHTAPISGVAFPSAKPKVVVSASLDGTVRVFDLHRYRNFRTLTTPSRRVQFSSLAVDSRGELVAAGGMDTFEAYLWSVQTGQLLVALAGHEAPISGLQFSPAGSATVTLATVSWDGTMRLWDFADSQTAREVVNLMSDALCVAYRPDGNEVAVAMLNGHILFFDPYSDTQVHSIEGHHDLGYTKHEGDKISAKRASEAKKFQAICYSTDGHYLLAAGDSKFICLYSVADQCLLARYPVTCNLSLDCVREVFDRRRMTEWGSMDLVDMGQEGRGKRLALPGVRSGEHSRRWWRPEVRVSSLQFSPTGDSFAAATTEGILIYSLDTGLSEGLLDPSGLDETVTPAAVRACVVQGEVGKGLEMALRLREFPLIEEVIEAVPDSQVEYLADHVPLALVGRTLLSFLCHQLSTSRHSQFYVHWSDAILRAHGTKLTRDADMGMKAALVDLQRQLRRIESNPVQRAESVQHAIDFLWSAYKLSAQSSDSMSVAEDQQ